MDEINDRLSNAATKCVACYASWRKDQVGTEPREALNEALHELRRATAALEIEMIRHERATPGARNIPTPGHRAMRRREGGEGGAEDEAVEHGDNIGNREDAGGGNHNQGGGHGGGGANMARHMRRRRPGGGRDQG